MLVNHRPMTPIIFNFPFLALIYLQITGVPHLHSKGVHHVAAYSLTDTERLSSWTVIITIERNQLRLLPPAIGYRDQEERISI